MKKRLLSLFSLFLLILPLAAGCGEEKDEVKVHTSVIALSGENGEANINDCARVIGGGTFNRGTQITIKLELATDESKNEVCKFYGWLVNNEKQSEDKMLTLTLNKPNIKDIYVEAMVSSDDKHVTDSSLIFGGIWLQNGANLVDVTSRAAFPTKDSIVPIASNIISSSSTKSIAIEKSTKLVKAITTNKDENENIDLRYIYLKSSSTGVFEIQPYELSWEEGKKNESGTGCSYDKSIDNPNDFVVTKIDTCIIATLTPKETEDGTTVEESKGKTTALDNLLDSEVYFSTQKNHKSMSATTANVPVDEKTFYGYKLNQLLNDKSSKYSVMYYGFNKDGLLEGVTTNSSGQRNYLICLDSELEGRCSTSKAMKINYNSSFSAYLGISDILEYFKKENGVYKKISEADIKYQFSSSGMNIESIKLNGITYYINIIDSKGKYYSPDGGETTITTTTNSNIYDISTEDNNLNDLVNEMDENVTNKLYSESEAEIKESVLKKIYATINNPDSEYNDLKGYIFDVEVDTVTHQITISKKPAKVSFNKSDLKFALDLNYYSGKVENVCSAQEESIKKCISDVSFVEFIYDYLLNDSPKSLSELKSIIIKEEGSKITYSIIMDDDTEMQIIYDDSTRTFTSNNSVIRFPVDFELTNTTFTEIKLKLHTVIGEIVQILDMKTNDVTTTLAGTNVSKDVNTIDILKLSEILKIAKVYKVSNNRPSGGTYVKETIYYISYEETIDEATYQKTMIIERKAPSMMGESYSDDVYVISYNDSSYILFPQTDE